MKALLEKVFAGEFLSDQEAETAMELMLSDNAQAMQTAAFLGAVQSRSETAEELSGFLKALRKKSIGIKAPENAIDVCGTGGDNSGTFNISTAVSFVVAAGGIPVVKHGNRSVSSRSGSADVLESLGVAIDCDVKKAEESLKLLNYCFCFAPQFNPVVKKVAEIRKGIGAKTIFNLLGPLINPAVVKRQIMGVYDVGRIEKVAQTLQKSGSIEVMVVSSEDGLDEITLCAPTKVAHLKDGKISILHVTPEDFGFKRAQMKDLMGGDSDFNAKIIEKILDGEKSACRDVVLINSAAAFVVSGLHQTFPDAVKHAAQVIDSKKAIQTLNELRKRK